MAERRLPPPWTVEPKPGGFKVIDGNGQSLAYVYSRENSNDAHMAKVLTEDEARRIASNIAKLPTLLTRWLRLRSEPPGESRRANTGTCNSGDGNRGDNSGDGNRGDNSGDGNNGDGNNMPKQVSERTRRTAGLDPRHR